MSSSIQDADSPRNAARTGEVRLTAAGETEVFDGARWQPLASIYQDPQDGSRQSPDEAQQFEMPYDDGPDGPDATQEPTEG